MTIAILVRDAKRFASGQATLRLLAEHWLAAGRRLEVISNPARARGGELAINHIDLTRTPPAWQPAFDRYERVINGALTDISKRRVSDQLVTAGDGYAGPVIIKSDNNYGGWPEVDYALEHELLPREVLMTEAWAHRRWIRPADYPVLDSAADVPGAVWANPFLVVERYLPERSDDGMGWTRCLNFLGDRAFHVRVAADDAVLRGGAITTRQVLSLDEVPDAVHGKRADLAMDFGRIDYALVDGEPVIYDANRTPTTSPAARVAYRELLADLARGIESLAEPAAKSGKTTTAHGPE